MTCLRRGLRSPSASLTVTNLDERCSKSPMQYNEGYIGYTNKADRILLLLYIALLNID